ncbi:MAG: aspartate kinase [Actinobacteria bacterium]|nr:aspartate kinase [Actinomycetota bacterium]
MAVIVQKYGGTSVGDAERIRAVARRVAVTRLAGHEVVVIVSAMGHTTDHFLDLSRQVSPNDHPREMDMLLTAGERISMALLAMAIRDLGVEAVSLTGSQAGILTNTVHGRAEIEEVRAFRVKEHLDRGDVVIVAGFQGVSAVNKEITTLGRGGSDATAVAMASYLGADACEVYTDVDGVFTADPRLVPEARKLDEVSYDEMAEMAGAGAAVLMSRSVELGRRWGVPLHVRSSFHHGEGTWVRPATAGPPRLIGIAHDPDQALVGLAAEEDAAVVAEALLAAAIPADTVGVGRDGAGAAVPRDQAAAAVAALAARPGSGEVVLNEGVGKVSLVGAGVADRPDTVARAGEVLDAAGIPVLLTAATPLRLSSLVPAESLDEAVRVLHGVFFAPGPGGAR